MAFIEDPWLQRSRLAKLAAFSVRHISDPSFFQDPPARPLVSAHSSAPPHSFDPTAVHRSSPPPPLLPDDPPRTGQPRRCDRPTAHHSARRQHHTSTQRTSRDSARREMQSSERLEWRPREDPASSLASPVPVTHSAPLVWFWSPAVLCRSEVFLIRSEYSGLVGVLRSVHPQHDVAFAERHQRPARRGTHVECQLAAETTTHSACAFWAKSSESDGEDVLAPQHHVKGVANGSLAPLPLWLVVRHRSFRPPPPLFSLSSSFTCLIVSLLGLLPFFLAVDFPLCESTGSVLLYSSPLLLFSSSLLFWDMSARE